MTARGLTRLLPREQGPGRGRPRQELTLCSAWEVRSQRQSYDYIKLSPHVRLTALASTKKLDSNPLRRIAPITGKYCDGVSSTPTQGFCCVGGAAGMPEEATAARLKALERMRLRTHTTPRYGAAGTAGVP